MRHYKLKVGDCAWDFGSYDPLSYVDTYQLKVEYSIMSTDEYDEIEDEYCQWDCLLRAETLGSPLLLIIKGIEVEKQ